MRILLMFWLVAMSTFRGVAQQSKYATISDSIAYAFWISCQNQKLEKLDLQPLETFCTQESTSKCLLNLKIARELKQIFEQEKFIYGLTPEKYTPSTDRMKELLEEAKEGQFYDVFLRTHFYLQFIYWYGGEFEKGRKIGKKAIAFFHNLPDSAKEKMRETSRNLANLYCYLIIIEFDLRNYDELPNYFDGALKWSERVYTESPKNNKKARMYARPRRSIARYYLTRGQTDSAMFYLDQAIEKIALKEDWKMLSSLNFSKAEIHFQKENYTNALDAILSAKDASKKANDRVTFLLGICAAADVYETLGDNKKLLEQEQELLQNYHQNSEISSGIQTNVFGLLSKHFERQEILDSAIFYGQKELEAELNWGASDGQFFVHIRLKKMYQKIGEEEKATDHFDRASILADEITWEDRNTTDILCELGDHYLRKGDYETSVKHASKAFRIAKKRDLLTEKEFSSFLLCEAYMGLGEMDSAQKYFHLQYAFKDSITKIAQDSVVFEIREKYETEEKEQKITQLNKENSLVQQRNNLYIGLIVLVMIIMFLGIYFYYKLRKTAIELRELQNTKDRLFSIIAHDLRTPFNALIGVTGILREDLRANKLKQVEETIGSIEQSSSQAYFLFEDLLGWTKAQTGKLVFKPEPLNLEQSLNNSIGILKSIIHFKNIELSTNLGANWVKADSYMLNTILRNLLTNALKYLKHNGKLKIVSKQEGDFVRIKILDNGEGISKTVLEDLLKYREGQTNGLGMLLCKEFVTKNGGKIGVESTLGQGTLAWFTLPIAISPQTETILQATISLESQGNVSLSSEEKQYLFSFIQELEQLEVYQISKIREVLEQIEYRKGSSIELWVKLVDKSTTSIDADFYQQLLETIKK